MKIFFRNTLLAMVAVLFMISSTGVYLTIHYCSSEGVRGLFPFSPLSGDPCDHIDLYPHRDSYAGYTGNDPATSGIGTCCNNPLTGEGNCSISDVSPECCSNTMLYISVEDDYVRTDHQTGKIYIIFLHSLLSARIEGATEKSDSPSAFTYKEPPPKFQGRELTLFNRTLLL